MLRQLARPALRLRAKPQSMQRAWFGAEAPAASGTLEIKNSGIVRKSDMKRAYMYQELQNYEEISNGEWDLDLKSEPLEGEPVVEDSYDGALQYVKETLKESFPQDKKVSELIAILEKDAEQIKANADKVNLFDAATDDMLDLVGTDWETNLPAHVGQNHGPVADESDPWDPERIDESDIQEAQARVDASEVLPGFTKIDELSLSYTAEEEAALAKETADQKADREAGVAAAAEQLFNGQDHFVEIDADGFAEKRVDTVNVAISNNLSDDPASWEKPEDIPVHVNSDQNVTIVKMNGEPIFIPQISRTLEWALSTPTELHCFLESPVIYEATTEPNRRYPELAH